MKQKIKIDIITLFVLIIVLVIGSMSVYCILVSDNGAPYLFQTHRGTEVMLYGGNSIYQEDSVIKALMIRSYDIANLVLIIPLLLIGLYLFRKKSMIGYFIVLSASMHLFYSYFAGVMMQSYNTFFLCYILIYSISLFTSILIIRKTSVEEIRNHVLPRLPKKSIAILLLIIAGTFLFMWLQIHLVALMNHQFPSGLEMYTTLEVHAMDLGLFVPFAVLGSVLLLKNNTWGAIISLSLLLLTLQTLISLNIYQVIGLLYQSGQYITFNPGLFIIMILTGFICIKSLIRMKGLKYQLGE